MFYERKNNQKLNQLTERELQLFYTSMPFPVLYHQNLHV